MAIVTTVPLPVVGLGGTVLFQMPGEPGPMTHDLESTMAHPCHHIYHHDMIWCIMMWCHLASGTMHVSSDDDSDISALKREQNLRHIQDYPRGLCDALIRGDPLQSLTVNSLKARTPVLDSEYFKFKVGHHGVATP